MLLLLSQMKEDRVKYSKESGYTRRRRRGNVSRHLLEQTIWISSCSAVASCFHAVAEETSYELRQTCLRYKNIRWSIMLYFHFGRTHDMTCELSAAVICTKEVMLLLVLNSR